MLKIFQRHDSDSQQPQSSDDIPNEKVRNGRAGRSLVWLLWGLAPSLPAVIHANVMSFVYQAELERSAAKNYGEDFAKALSYYKEALDTVNEWASLVGTLAVIVRYVKIKCLQLDTALFLQRMLRDALGQDDGSERVKAAWADIGLFLTKCKYNLQGRSHEEAGKASMETLEKIRADFWSPAEKELTLARGLAIHPDVAPSSLFGDDWMKDLFQRASVKYHFENTYIRPPDEESSDNPLSVNGIFGEVEQWLWASSRSLRKLRQRVQYHQVMRIEESGQHTAAVEG